MHLLVGIPALDEEATIAAVIGAIPHAIDGVERVSVVVADDGSTDATRERAEAAGAHVISHGWNYGVGVAFQTMVRHALATRADLLVTIDGDGQFDPADIPRLLAPILSRRAAVVTASRFLDPALVPVMPAVKRWGNRRVAQLVHALSGRRYADVSCGFRAYSREALLNLTVFHSFTYTHETFLDLTAKRIPIVEVPLAIRGTREHGQSRVASSITRYAFRTALIMVRTYRDQKPLELCTALSVPPVLLGLVLLCWSYVHVLRHGVWLKAVAFAGAASLAVSVALLFFGFMADIATRLRQNQEEILYWQRRGEPSGDDNGSKL